MGNRFLTFNMSFQLGERLTFLFDGRVVRAVIEKIVCTQHSNKGMEVSYLLKGNDGREFSMTDEELRYLKLSPFKEDEWK